MGEVHQSTERAQGLAGAKAVHSNVRGSAVRRRVEQPVAGNGAWRSLVSAPALGAGGRRFESGRPDRIPAPSTQDSSVGSRFDSTSLDVPRLFQFAIETRSGLVR